MRAPKPIVFPLFTPSQVIINPVGKDNILIRKTLNMGVIHWTCAIIWKE